MKRYLFRWAAAMFVAVAMIAPAWSESGEKKVALADVPEPVRQAIVKEVGNGRLVDIGEFAGEGETLYEIEMVANGEEYDVLFASDGTMREKSLEGKTKEDDNEQDQDGEGAAAYQEGFDLGGRELASSGRTRYFILEPGYRLVLEGKEGSRTVSLRITVLEETRTIDAIETRVVEERESVNGDLVEISRNFYAIDKKSGTVFYFGEDVDIYRDGRVVGHEGAWRHGKDGARAGMMMPGEPALGARYYQEIAPGVAMDRAAIVDTDVTLRTPAGTFRGCLKTREENPLDGEKEFKIHAPGIGLVQDEDLLLVEHGFVKP